MVVLHTGAAEGSGAPSRVFDDICAEWINYASPSDALIAKLHLDAHIPARYITAFLDVLHNPHFNVKHLSFRSCTDIDKSVAEYRHAQAVKRVACSRLPSARVPYDVFALIVEAVARERLPLRTDDSSVFGKLPPGQKFPDRIASRLKALSLTHRTITPLAQRALGQRTFVHIGDDLLALARSPLLGPWTTELVVNLHFSSPITGAFSAPEDALDYAVAILRRAPGLKFLRIRTPPYFEQESPEKCFRKLLDAIRSLELLETLWLIAPENAYHRVDLEDVCDAVSGMPRLRSLILKNAQCGMAELGGADLSLGGQHHLEELSLTDLRCSEHPRPLEETCMAWLLGSPSLTSLALSTDVGIKSLLLSVPVIPHLHTLRIKLPILMSLDYLSEIFSAHTPSLSSHSSSPLQTQSTSNLRTLYLSCQGSQFGLWHYHLAGIPSTVRVLRLGLFQLGACSPEGQGKCAQQECELIHFLTGQDVGSTTSASASASTPPPLPSSPLALEELDIAVPIQQSYAWTRLREVCESQGRNLIVRKVMQVGFV